MAKYERTHVKTNNDYIMFINVYQLNQYIVVAVILAFIANKLTMKL